MGDRYSCYSGTLDVSSTLDENEVDIKGLITSNSEATTGCTIMLASRQNSTFQDQTNSIKVELTSFCPPDWPDHGGFEGQEYIDRCDFHQLLCNVKKDRNATLSPNFMRQQPVPLLPALPSQVHDRSVTHSRKSGTTDYPRTLWTPSELKHCTQEQDDQASLLSVPSLTSSGISSVRTNVGDSFFTLEGFSIRSPVSYMTTQPNICDASVSESGNFLSIDLPEISSHTKFAIAPRYESSKLSRIAKPCDNDVDWAKWSPSNFQCTFCRERFLMDSQLQGHLRTHKRFQKHLKYERKHKLLDSSSLSSLNTPNQDLSRKSLAYRLQYTAIGDSEIPLSVTDVSRDESVLISNSEYHPSCPREVFLNRIRDANEEHTTSTDVKMVPSILHEEESITFDKGPEKSNITMDSTPYSSRCSTLFRGTTTKLETAIEPQGKSSAYLEVRWGRGGRQIDEDDAPGIFFLEADSTRHSRHTRDIPSINLLMALMKQRLATRIMDEFMAILKHDRSNIRSCTSAPSSTSNNAPPSNSRASTHTHTNLQSQQRNSENEGDEVPSNDDDGGDDQRAPKRPRPSSFPTITQQDSSKFACPFRKHDPRKYSVRNWRPCALTPLDSISRVKAHLYRHHRIFQCQRCKSLFANQSVLDEHVLDVQGCAPNRINLVEGVTAEIEKKLRCRKKAYRNQTESERWNEVYHTLFPTAVLLPSPFFEPVEENVEQSPDAQKLADFEEYTRSELPRILWAALEEVLSNEMRPVEERLRKQLMGVIRDCQARVFSTYESMLNSNFDPSLHDDSARENISTMFKPLCRTMLAQSDVDTGSLVPSVDETATTIKSGDGTSESGYASNFSAVNSFTTLSSIFDSSTTLSSIFNSSTTLSSIASSNGPPPLQPLSSELTGKMDEMNAGAKTKESMSVTTTAKISNDDWTADLVQTDLSQFDVDDIWNLGFNMQAEMQ